MKTDHDLDDATGLAEKAKRALERVCSGAGLDPPDVYYAPTFVDHVNDLEFRGLTGTAASVELYKQALSDLRIEVVEQLVEGPRVTSRFVVTGRCGSRHVRFNGITISRFEAGRIVEDWSVTDTLGMLRQIGAAGSIAVGLRSWRSLLRLRSAHREMLA